MNKKHYSVYSTTDSSSGLSKYQEKATEEKEESKITTSDYQLQTNSCLNLSQTKLLMLNINKYAIDTQLPIESIIDGRSESDAQDLIKLLQKYNDEIIKLNSTCQTIEISKIKYLKKTFDRDLVFIGLDITDTKNHFCFPCYDRSKKNWIVGIKGL